MLIIHLCKRFDQRVNSTILVHGDFKYDINFCVILSKIIFIKPLKNFVTIKTCPKTCVWIGFRREWFPTSDAHTSWGSRYHSRGCEKWMSQWQETNLHRNYYSAAFLFSFAMGQVLYLLTNHCWWLNTKWRLKWLSLSKFILLQRRTILNILYQQTICSHTE